MSWGAVTVKRHAELKAEGKYLAIFVNGEDVTHRCRFFDDRPGSKVAELFKHNQHDRPYIDMETGEAATETVHDFDIVVLSDR